MFLTFSYATDSVLCKDLTHKKNAGFCISCAIHYEIGILCYYITTDV